MKVSSKISVRKQVALFSFTFLFLLTTILHVYAKDNFGNAFQNQKKTALTKPYTPLQKFIFSGACWVNASDSGIVSEKEAFILPVISFLRILLFYPEHCPLSFSADFFGCKILRLFRILPNAP
jgi:hypothetical protein